MRKLIFVSFLIFSFLACAEDNNNDDVEACTDEARSGIAVVVFDNDGNPVSCDAEVIIEDQNSDYTEIAETCNTNSDNDPTLFGLEERPGTYRITVSKEGYLDSVVENIEVLADECHVITTTVIVTLEKET